MKRSNRNGLALSGTVLALSLASWETIARRSWMMMSGTCEAAEYARMVQEKVLAMQQSGLALLTGQGPAAVLRPFHRKASANARRLRRKSA